MARPITQLAIFFIAFNLFAGMLMTTGVDAMLGIDAEVGGDQVVDDVESESDNVQTGTSLGNTLFGMYNVLAGSMSTLFGSIFPGLSMLNNAGVPSYITNLLLGPIFSFVITVGIVSFLRGWGL